MTVLRSGAAYAVKAIWDVDSGKTVGQATKDNLPLSVLTAISGAAKIAGAGTKGGPVAAGASFVITAAIVKAACFPAPPYRHKGEGLINQFKNPPVTNQQTDPNRIQHTDQQQTDPNRTQQTDPNTNQHTDQDMNQQTDPNTNQHTDQDMNQQTDPNTNQHTDQETETTSNMPVE
ncbi:hypothetical protein [Streptomyces sp. NBC_01207]|uniref:hypothetical protein n=1 Tax=Streptomyces sp. NBC_01207 TaxID=2903772 RepID=UPI002E102812|nr:hypothetical protein OG457_30330 [Streptomyces sp. NBC_01207]